MEARFIKEHTMYKYANDVKQICEHLFANTPINYFCLNRAYKTGEYAGLISDIKFAEAYLKKDYHEVGIEHQIISQITGNYPWNMTTFKPTHNKARLIYEILIQFRHGSGIFLIEEHAEYKETCIITTPHPVDSNDPYLIENIALLKNFILHFKEKIQANKNLRKAFHTRYKRDILTKKFINIPDKSEIKFPIKKYYIGGSFRDIAFSKREAECLKHLFHGKTCKQIAQALQLSPRTVETYLDKIKLKSSCNNLQELCKKLESCTLLDGI